MIRINLAPLVNRRTEDRPGIDLRLAFGAPAILMAIVAAAVTWVLAAEVAGLRRDIEQSRAELARLKPIVAEAPRRQAERQDLERRLAAVESIARNQARPAHLLDALGDLPPKDLWLTRVEEKGQQLKLSGMSSSSGALAELLATLARSARFKDVDLIESRQDLKASRAIIFEVSCRFEI